MNISNEKLMQEDTYTLERIYNAALIIHPSNIDKYGLVQDKISQVFEEGSNFFTLQNPIFDEFGNEYRDSEGYYMAQRIKDLSIKKLISKASFTNGKSKKTAYLYRDLLETDNKKRIQYMRNAITLKFDNNPTLQELLFTLKGKEIIEYTYRGDSFFGIDHIIKKGANILGKLLSEYRDNNT